MRTWAKSSLYLAVGLVVVGFGLIFLAWNGAASKDFIQGQFPYVLSGGVTGLAFILCGLTLAATQSFRRDILTLQDRLEELLGGGAPVHGGGSTQPTLTAVPDDGNLFVATAAAYHLSSCRTVQGRSGLELLSADDVASRDLPPCRVCNPVARTASA
ncbi:MAG TPA: hypothetical protein VF230_17640 [Acidimicrobiales bacterium]